MGSLTAMKVRHLTAAGRYGDGDGLWLQVRDAKRKSWLFRFMLRGKAREMGLGSTRDVTLAEARDAASGARRLLRQGVDPIAAREALRPKAAPATTVNTFKDVAERYIAAHEAGWRNPKHRQQWRNTLTTYAEPAIGSLPVAAIDTGRVTAILEPIWRTKPETASRLRGRLEAVLDYARVMGWREGENPARWKGHLDHILPARGKVARVEHHAALPWRDMNGFMATLADQDGAAALALRFAILTAARTGEALGATWGEIDLSAALWTIPGARMKAGREHRVPLSDAALAVLAKAAEMRIHKGADAPLFPGATRTGKPLSNMAMLMLLRRMGRDDLTAHGFRSSFRDWVAEATSHPREIAEAALAHTTGTKVEAAYFRSDVLEKRRRLMADWATFCCSKPDANITVLPTARVAAA